MQIKRPSPKRRRRRVLLAAACLGLLVAGAAAALWLYDRPDPPGQAAPEAEDISPEGGSSADQDPSPTPEPVPEPASEPVSSAPPETDGFARLYYYEADKAQRYAEYARLHPELNEGEVVWRVNAGLDGRHYVDYEPARNTGSAHYIVSKYRRLPDDFVPEGLVDVGGYPMTAETAGAYYAFQAAGRAAGYRFSAVSGYRSIDSQRRLYEGYLQKDSAEVVDTYSARPGFSEHHTGRAVDLAGSSGGLLDFENTPECAYVHENAHLYGFILRYPQGWEWATGYQYEPWHITYVGVEIATDMFERGIPTLEEYTVKFIEHRPEH